MSQSKQLIAMLDYSTVALSNHLWSPPYIGL